MAVGHRRTAAARLLAIVGFACGVLGLIAGSSDLVWKFGSTGWFTGGSLILLADGRFDIAFHDSTGRSAALNSLEVDAGIAGHPRGDGRNQDASTRCRGSWLSVVAGSRRRL